MKWNHLDYETKKKICSEYQDTRMSYRDLAQKYNVSEKTIYNINKNFTGKSKNTGTRPKKIQKGGSDIKPSKKEQQTSNYIDDLMKNRDSTTGELITTQSQSIDIEPQKKERKVISLEGHYNDILSKYKK